MLLCQFFPTAGKAPCSLLEHRCQVQQAFRHACSATEKMERNTRADGICDTPDTALPGIALSAIKATSLSDGEAACADDSLPCR